MRLKSIYKSIIQEFHDRRAFVPSTERLMSWPALLIILWLIALLFTPFVEELWGKEALTRTVAFGVIIQSAIVLSLMVRAIGTLRTAIIATQIVVLTWGIEAVGSARGLPFGIYSYTDRLQPQLAGVPVLIPLAWLMMLPPSWAVAQSISGNRSGLRFIILSALAFTAWDLFLDPQMVQWKLWLWEQPGRYFGIPLINFAGWLLAAALVTWIVHPNQTFLRKKFDQKTRRDKSCFPSLPRRPLLLMYSLTWIMETCGLAIFWNLRGPAVTGFIVMGAFVVLAYYRQRIICYCSYGQ